MNSRSLILGAALGAALFASPARADDNTVSIGLILPMTGPSASTGKQEQRLRPNSICTEHGDTVAGKKINLDCERRHGRRRRHEAARGRADWQRSRERPDGLRSDAAGAGRRAGSDGGQGPGDRHRRRELR